MARSKARKRSFCKLFFSFMQRKCKCCGFKKNNYHLTDGKLLATNMLRTSGYTMETGYHDSMLPIPLYTFLSCISLLNVGS